MQLPCAVHPEMTAEQYQQLVLLVKRQLFRKLEYRWERERDALHDGLSFVIAGAEFLLLRPLLNLCRVHLCLRLNSPLVRLKGYILSLFFT